MCGLKLTGSLSSSHDSPLLSSPRNSVGSHCDSVAGVGPQASQCEGSADIGGILLHSLCLYTRARQVVNHLVCNDDPIR